MKTSSIITAFLLVFCLIDLNAQSIPKGWWAANTAEYKISVDPAGSPQGGPAAIIESIVSEPEKFIALNQTISAEEYLGKRVRFSGDIKTQDVQKWSGFWLRADDMQGKIVAFQNMQNRGIKGTTDWKNEEIILDIPKEAHALYFGLILDGAGKAWASGLSFEVVDSSTPLTEGVSPVLRKAPVNLDFSE